MVGDFGCYVILAGRLLLEAVWGGLCSLVCVIVYDCKLAFVGMLYVLSLLIVLYYIAFWFMSLDVWVWWVVICLRYLGCVGAGCVFGWGSVF